MTKRSIQAWKDVMTKAGYGSDMTEQVELTTDDIYPRDEEHRYRLYVLCPDPACNGTGKIDGERCWACRGEGRRRECIAACPTPEALGVMLVQLGREGQLAECPNGCLDVLGEPNQRWLWRPWLPSARNLSDAGRQLATARKGK